MQFAAKHFAETWHFQRVTFQASQEIPFWLDKGRLTTVPIPSMYGIFACQM